MKSKIMLVALLISCAGANATTVPYKNFKQLVDGSQHAVGGVVKDVSSSQHSDSQIYTIVTLAGAYTIDENGANALRGEAKIRYLGGSVAIKDDQGKVVGQEVLKLEGTPEFRKGERVVLFVSNNGVASMPIYGWGQGVFRVGENDGVHDAEGNPVIALSGADIVTETPSGLMVKGRLLGPKVARKQSVAAPEIVGSDGGPDFIRESAPDERVKSALRAAYVRGQPLHLSNFESIIQERKAQVEFRVANRSSFSGKGGARIATTSELLALPPVDGLGEDGVALDVAPAGPSSAAHEMPDRGSTPSEAVLEWTDE